MTEQGEAIKVRQLMDKWLDSKEAAKVLRTAGFRQNLYENLSLIFGAGFPYEYVSKGDSKYNNKLDFILAINRLYDMIYYVESLCIIYEYTGIDTDVYDKTLVLLEHLELEVRENE
jgi:hypothetical protein